MNADGLLLPVNENSTEIVDKLVDNSLNACGREAIGQELTKLPKPSAEKIPQN